MLSGPLALFMFRLVNNCTTPCTCTSKKGDKHTASNYRPVSLTCVCCKLLEHIICRHILKHLENNRILTSLQYGFRSSLALFMFRLVNNFTTLCTSMLISLMLGYFGSLTSGSGSCAFSFVKTDFNSYSAVLPLIYFLIPKS
jgi:hypothetical protein